MLDQVQALDQTYLQDWADKRKQANEEAAKTAKSDDIPQAPSAG